MDRAVDPHHIGVFLGIQCIQFPHEVFCHTVFPVDIRFCFLSCIAIAVIPLCLLDAFQRLRILRRILFTFCRQIGQILIPQRPIHVFDICSMKNRFRAVLFDLLVKCPVDFTAAHCSLHGFKVFV